jgi:hypothetical protein
MALCTRCGRQTEPDAESCLACGGYLHDASSVAASSPAAARAVHLPAGGHGAPSRPAYQQAWPDDRDSIDPRWRPEPAPSQVRSRRRSRAPAAPGQTVPAAPPRAAGGAHSGRWIAIAVSTTVVCVAAVVTIVLLGHHSPAGHAARAAHGTTTGTPASSRSAGVPQPTASGAVTVEPAAASEPHEGAVVAVLTRYFRAINNHSYGAYERLFSPALRTGLSLATFTTGYGSTRDSAEALQSIGVPGAGQLEAIVTFTSHQLAADSPTQSPCTAWRISLYLIRQGRRYLLAVPPQGYQASYRSCS